jgi:hypothetical protein
MAEHIDSKGQKDCVTDHRRQFIKQNRKKCARTQTIVALRNSRNNCKRSLAAIAAGTGLHDTRPKVSRSGVIREVAEDGQRSAKPCRTLSLRLSIQNKSGPPQKPVGTSGAT